ncbi:MAG TPA: AMP-binding protein [Thermoleophilaceae bacterium]|nr:AMP-binding protein [Thermoleophilaceae bacterium]
MNLASWLDRAGNTHPEQPAMAVGDVVVSSYRQLARRSAGLATGLRRRHGLNPGDSVAIVSANHPAYLEALFAIWWAGLVAVPVNSKLHAAEIGWILDHAGARAAFVSRDLEPTVGGLEPPAPRAVISFHSAEYERLTAEDPGEVAARDSDEVAWLFYTSGTTGRPKGAMLTHRNLVTMSVAYLSELDPTSPGDAVLHAAPLSHGAGLWAIPHVCRKALNVLPESGSFDPSEIADLMGTWAGTSMFAAPTMLRRLVEHPGDIDTSRIRTIIWGGAPMHVTDVVGALDRLGPCLTQAYGQGESPMTISHLPKEDVADRSHPHWLERLASAGIPSALVEVRVVDDEDQTIASGEAGEVLVRGDTVMRGYRGDPDASALALRGGWLHTGDIGMFDDEGYLTLKDRSKDMIISGGSNIYPREVEEVLCSHPGVAEVSVVGRPDPDWGEIVVAYVVGEADRDELDQLCLNRIARFKRPKEYIFVPSLPKSNYGKILKTELRAIDRSSLEEA